MSLKLNSSGGGSVTLQEPATASTLTLNLPAFSGTAATLASVTNNGVLYVNSSGQPTSGSALTFDGTGLSVTGSTSATLKLNGRSSDNASSANFYDNTGATRYGFFYFDPSNAQIATTNATPLAFLINSSERMRLDSSGNLLVGTTATGLRNSNSLSLEPAASGAAFVNHASGSASGNGYIFFGFNAGAIGSITQSGTTAVLYNTTSDQRLKENIQDAEDAATLIDAIQVRQYDWKSDGSHQRYGFIAQELVAVAPEAVHQPADPDDMMAVDYSKLVPMLVKEIQSLRKRLTALEQA